MIGYRLRFDGSAAESPVPERPGDFPAVFSPHPAFARGILIWGSSVGTARRTRNESRPEVAVSGFNLEDPQRCTELSLKATVCLGPPIFD